MRIPPRSPSASTVAPQAYLDATNAVLTGLVDGAASIPADSPVAERVNRYVAAAKQSAVGACPASCMDLGSFYVVFEAAGPCLCSGAEQYPMLLDAATNTWKVGGRGGLVQGAGALS
jgi:hypothetical protein